MNILILGNGFDLTYELPTKYADFMQFVRAIRELLKKAHANVDWDGVDIRIKSLITTSITSNLPIKIFMPMQIVG